MANRQELDAERARYKNFIESVENKTQKAAAEQRAPLEEAQQKWQVKLAKLEAKVKSRSKKPLDDDAIINKMTLFEKRKLKKLTRKLDAVTSKIEAINDKYDEIREYNTKSLYNAQLEIDRLIAQTELLESPDRLIAFANKLLADILIVEIRPDFQNDIKRRWDVLQEIVVELLKSPHNDLSTFKAHLEELSKNNDGILRMEQYNLEGLNDTLTFLNQPEQKKSLQDQLDKKSNVIALRNEFSDLLKTIVAKIPTHQMSMLQNKPPEVVLPVANSSSTGPTRPSSIRFSENKPEVSAPAKVPAGKVAKNIAFFEGLAEKNKKQDEQSKKPKRR